MSYDDWLDENEYPSDKDMDDLGDDSPVDYDPLTVGYLGDSNRQFWTTRNIIIAVVVIIMVGALLLPPLLSLLN